MIKDFFIRIVDFFKRLAGRDEDYMEDPMIFAKKSREAVKKQQKERRFLRQKQKKDKETEEKDNRKAPQDAKTGRNRRTDKNYKNGKPQRNGRQPQKKAEEPMPPMETRGKDEAQAELPTEKRKRAPRPRKPPWNPEVFQVEPQEGKTRFHDLNLPLGLLHAIYDLKFEYCTPIQAEILPKAITGRDATGKAQTGTGKTAAFLISIIAQFKKKPIKGKRDAGFPRALILAPTRELALQIEKDARALTKYTQTSILCTIGGTGFEKQKNILQKKPLDIIVATPGRLLDFAQKKLLNLSKVETLVIDEADRMLDMGFIPDIRRIVHMTPPKENRQTLFFSATLTDEVIRLGSQWTREPFTAEIEPDQVESSSIDQKTYLTTRKEKFSLLYNIITKENLSRIIIFTNRRDQARDLTRDLSRTGIKSALISGELSQSKRTQALENFRSGKITALVATDVAARGIHIDDISHVVNYNIPQDADHYVHRIGRTGRAGSTGISISFADEDESFNIPAIEELLGHSMNCEYPPEELTVPPKFPERKKNEGNDKEKDEEKKDKPPYKRRRKPGGKPGGKPFANRKPGESRDKNGSYTKKRTYNKKGGFKRYGRQDKPEKTEKPQSREPKPEKQAPSAPAPE